jgi:outer membrane biosynthesis protein TonB
MEELIPLLIIIASGIISFFASARKQKGNKQAEETFEFNDDPAQYEESDQNQQETEDEQRYSRFFGETVEERKLELTEEEEEPAEEKHKQVQEKREPQKQKPKVAAPKQKQREKTKIETIRDRFDVEEAIIYSEIINRKYF